MRHTHKIGLLALAALLALAGVAAAGPSLDLRATADEVTGDAHAFVDGDDPVAHATSHVSTDDATASTETLANGSSRYADADAGLATEEAGAALDTDASLSDPGTVEDDGASTWIEVGWSAFATKVTDLLGLDGSAADGGVAVYASDDGVDVDAPAGGESFDDSPAGDADGETWSLMAKLKHALGCIFD